MSRGVDSKTLKRLEEWQAKAEPLPELVEFYQKLLDIQSGAEGRAGIPAQHLDSKAISERLDSGSPLVSFAELDLDWPLLEDIFAEVATTFAHYPQLFGALPDSVISTGKGELLKEAVMAWFEGASPPAALLATGVSEPLLADIIQATLKPLLVGYSKALLGSIKQETWRRGYCPICGGNPDFTLLHKDYGERWLLCSRCDSQWVFQRLQCPYCGNQNQDTLAYFSNDAGLYRLYVCDQCQQYLKAIDLRKTEEEVIISLERLFTLGIDVQAQEHGYSHSGAVAQKNKDSES